MAARELHRGERRHPDRAREPPLGRRTTRPRNTHGLDRDGGRQRPRLPRQRVARRRRRTAPNGPDWASSCTTPSAGYGRSRTMSWPCPGARWSPSRPGCRSCSATTSTRHSSDMSTAGTRPNFGRDGSLRLSRAPQSSTVDVTTVGHLPLRSDRTPIIPPCEILVLGAGFGGLELTTRLSLEFGAGPHEIVLIDQADGFVFGFSKLDVMFGRARPEAVVHPYRDFVKPGVRFVQATIDAIDPERADSDHHGRVIRGGHHRRRPGSRPRPGRHVRARRRRSRVLHGGRRICRSAIGCPPSRAAG